MEKQQERRYNKMSQHSLTLIQDIQDEIPLDTI
jgi:hypothetical protein